MSLPAPVRVLCYPVDLPEAPVVKPLMKCCERRLIFSGTDQLIKMFAEIQRPEGSEWTQPSSQAGERELLSDWGAHHNRDQPRVPPNPVFSPVLGHLFVTPGSFQQQKKKRKHLQSSEVFLLSELKKVCTFEVASNTGLSAK